MASGTIDGKVTQNSTQYTFYATWSSVPNTEGNYSDVTVSTYWGKTGTTLFDSVGDRNASITINGDTTTISKRMDYNPWVKDPIQTKTTRVYHNTDGTKSIVISARANGRAGSYGPSNSTAESGDCTASATVTLDAIPRASSVACTNANIGAKPTITITRASSAFTHTLKYSFGTLSGTIVEKTTSTSYSSWTIPTTFYAQIPKAKTGTCTITCETYSGSTLIGSKTTTFTVTAAESACAPTLSPIITDIDEAMNIVTGDYINDNGTTTDGVMIDRRVFVKGFSDAQFKSGATAKNSATIVSQKVTCGKHSSTSGTGTFTNIESPTFTFTATDSRGYSVSKTVTLNMIDYIKLTCNVTIDPPTTQGETYVHISGNWYNGHFGLPNWTLNFLHVYIRYKVNDGEWSDWDNLSDTSGSYWADGSAPIQNNTYSGKVYFSGLDYRSKYTFQVKAEDAVLTATTPEYSVKTTPVFDWGDSDFAFNVPVIFNAGFTQATAIDEDECTGDYVIEQGIATVDGFPWTYRKWNSGIAECWGISNISTAVTTSWGALYVSGYIAATDKKFPFTFTSVPNVNATLSGSGAGAFLIASGSGSPSTTSTGVYEIARGTSLTSGTFKINYQVKGKWK